MSTSDDRRELIRQLGGEDAVAELMGVSVRMVRYGIKDGFPATWFDALDIFGRRQGVTVSRDAFVWKQPGNGAPAADEAAA